MDLLNSNLCYSTVNCMIIVTLSFGLVLDT